MISSVSKLRLPIRDEPEESSPLAALRLRRKLSLEEAAARTNLPLEDIRALEEGRIYRFRSVDAALAAALVYATALGISEREARRSGGLPVGPEPTLPVRRWLALGAFAAAVFALLWFGVKPKLSSAPAPVAGSRASTQSGSALPDPWQIRVDVYNGTQQPNGAARIANRVAGLAYRIGNLGNATRSDYTRTRVYYPPGAEAIARRLAAQLGVGIEALPGGKDRRRLVVIVGARG
jgi:transcriptional regulator with XRE-family HTH domain